MKKLPQKHESYREPEQCCATCHYGVYHHDYEGSYGPYCELVRGVVAVKPWSGVVEFYGKSVTTIACTDAGDRMDKLAKVSDQGWCEKWEASR